MKQAFKFQTNLAESCGIRKSRSLIWKIIHTFAICSMSYDLFTCIIFIQKNHSDVIETAEALVPITTCPIGMSKLILMIIYSTEIYDLVEDIRRINAECKLKKEE